MVAETDNRKDVMYEVLKWLWTQCGVTERVLDVLPRLEEWIENGQDEARAGEENDE